MAVTTKPYDLKTEGLWLPVAITGLPDEIDVLGRTWWAKEEFHVTILHSEYVREQYPVSDGEIETALRGLIPSEPPLLRATGEVRSSSLEQKQSVIVMVTISGLSELYQGLNHQLGTKLEVPPVHITVYTNELKQGIFVHDQDELQKCTLKLSTDDERVVRQAMRFDEVFGHGT
jgi:hypothetical protein